MTAAARPAGTPWYRHGMMWLVVGGPLVVVVASFVTLGLAISGADVVIEEPAARAVHQPGSADAPAIKGRNNASAATRP